jgi:hypothetical protein
VLFATAPPKSHTPRHPFNGAVKNKACFVLWPCACGRFIHFISIPFRRSVLSASLHSLHYPSLHSAYVHFTNLSTAQQKQFILCIPQSHNTGFPCHGVCLSLPQWLLCFDKLQKPPTLSRQTAHATPSHQPGLLHSVQSLTFALDPPHD